MKLDYLREKKELVSVVLLGVSAVLAVLILVKVRDFFTAPARAESLIKTAIERNNTDPKDMDEYFAKYKALANELKKNNLFVPPAPKQHPVKEVWGIFGDEVIIRDKLYKVGDKVGEAKIVAIEPTQVTIEWDGKKKTFVPFDAKGSSQPGGPRGSRATASSGRPGGGSAQMVAVGSERRPMGRPEGGKGPGRGGMGGMRDRSRAEMQVRRAEQDQENYRKLQEMWPTLPEQTREKIRNIQKRWPTMSEEERDRVRAGNLD